MAIHGSRNAAMLALTIGASHHVDINSELQTLVLDMTEKARSVY